MDLLPCKSTVFAVVAFRDTVVAHQAESYLVKFDDWFVSLAVCWLLISDKLVWACFNLDHFTVRF